MDYYSSLFASKVSGGGSGVTVEPLSVTENGTYQEEGKAYSPVNVNVPTNEWIKRDGKTHLHIDIYNDIYLTVHMMFGQTVASGNTIYWGDGTSTTPTNTSPALQNHTYAQKGKYEITIENISGYFYFGQSPTTKGYIFQDGITDGSNEKYAHYCTILKKLELGKGWKADTSRQFAVCKNLTSVFINTKPDQTKLEANMFSGCVSLNYFDGVAKYNEGITSLGNSVFSSTVLQNMPVFPSVDSIPNNYLSGINGAGALGEINIWEGVTSIGQQAFRYQNMACEIIIPSTCTSINSQAFEGAYGIHGIHVKSATPPTLSNANAFSVSSNVYDFKIYVPSASLETYQTASNWSSFASYMIGE